MTYERLLVRLHRREPRALEDLYDITAAHLYVCLYIMNAAMSSNVNM